MHKQPNYSLERDSSYKHRLMQRYGQVMRATNNVEKGHLTSYPEQPVEQPVAKTQTVPVETPKVQPVAEAAIGITEKQQFIADAQRATEEAYNASRS